MAVEPLPPVLLAILSRKSEKDFNVFRKGPLIASDRPTSEKRRDSSAALQEASSKQVQTFSSISSKQGSESRRFSLRLFAAGARDLS